MKKNTSVFTPVIIIIGLGILLFFIKNCRQRASVKTTSSSAAKTASRGLNRHPEKIVYSQHAQCRMDCRHITEAEIKEVLEEGKINYRKSDLKADDCHKRYAVEDKVNNQNIRLVVAQCKDELTVITCIDLDKDWSCQCD